MATKMFATKFGLFVLYCLILNDLISAKKLEEIFTCANETECDELLEKEMLEEGLSTTSENIYNATQSSSANSSMHPAQTTKIQITPTTETPREIKYNSEIRNQSIQSIVSDICECDLTVCIYFYI